MDTKVNDPPPRAGASFCEFAEIFALLLVDRTIEAVAQANAVWT